MLSAPRTRWTLALVGIALFMVTLDNLVVTTALPSIHASLGGGISTLEWTVNAYTLTYAVLLLTGAALGDRFGRRRIFVYGLFVFSLASAAAALAPSTGALIAARAVQGAGAAMVTPLTLTLLTDAVPGEGRGLVLGLWSGIAGLGVALGPVVGGAIVSGISWHWIFWVNVPIGLVIAPLAARHLVESHGPDRRLDLPGVFLVGGGLLGIVYGIVRGHELGWTSTTIVASLAAGTALVIAFLIWETRTPAPMLPLRFFRNRAFAATNGVSLAMYFGTFGVVFLLAQFFQVAQHLTPLQLGAADVGVDGDADGRRTAGRPVLRPHRLTAVPGRRAGAAGDRAAVDPPDDDAGRRLPDAAAGADARRHRDGDSCSPRPPTPSSGRSAPTRSARPRARPTRSASWAACSASRCSRRCSARRAATRRRRRSRRG